MIIQEFSFGNFNSFKDIQTLNLSAAKIKSKNEITDTSNVIEDNKYNGVSFLKSKAIYGANASGKSNIIAAFAAFILIIRESVKDETILNLVESYKLSTETENEPSFFQLIFWHQNIKYRYGFELDNSNISAEWLYAKPNERELPYFIRENQKIIEIDKTNFNEGHKLISLFDNESGENEIFRNNSLFLSSISSLGFGKLSKELVGSIASIILISGLGDPGLYAYASDSLDDVKKKKYIIDFLKYGDIGIEDINTYEISPEDIDEETLKDSDKNKKRRIIVSSKRKYNKSLEFEENVPFHFKSYESEGTIKLFELSSHIYTALKENRPIIIDEFDARLHPLLTKKILELFNSKQNSESQLIFTTHDTNLLSSDLLRRDQIEFVEKDKYGASHLYSLVQFKGIRNTASFEKDYIQGKYGAIPFLGDFNKLINPENNA